MSMLKTACNAVMFLRDSVAYCLATLQDCLECLAGQSGSQSSLISYRHTPSARSVHPDFGPYNSVVSRI